MQTRGERGTRGLKLPVLMAQAHPAPHEVLALGVGEEDPAIPGQEKNGETGDRDCRAERVGCCSRAGQEVMDRRRALQMRREGFQEVPFRRLHPHRIGRSCKNQKRERIGCAREPGGDEIGPSLRADKFIVIGRGSKTIGLGV